jgi:pyruvate formate lyase activating enzyme
MCLTACPHGALSDGGFKRSRLARKDIRVVNLDREKCAGCLRCADVCNAKALFRTCREMAIDSIMEIVRKDDLFYKNSDGGVTISGGEPLLQLEFLTNLLREVKANGYTVALDTTGSIAWTKYDSIADHVDLLLYDLKTMDADKMRDAVLGDLDLILDNARKFAARGSLMQMRYPVIPGFNDDMRNAVATADFCASLGQAVRAVQVLPYHRLGLGKYERIGKKYTMPDAKPPSNEQIEGIRRLFTDRGIDLQD